MQTKCHCKTLEACGKGIFQSGRFQVKGVSLSPPRRRQQ
jgi:hypothetical protein